MDGIRNINKDFRRGLLLFVIMQIIKRERAYPYALLKIIKKSKNPILCSNTKSDVYNAISSLEKSKLIKITERPGSLKFQKYYVLTKMGKGILKEQTEILGSTLKNISKLVQG